MENEPAAIALLLFRVGPVLCCAPADPVQSIIAPPKLTRPPGANEAKPGIFYHANHVVSVSDLRHRFGISAEAREQPGRMIITVQNEALVAYWVDEIIEVIDTPKQGWSPPPGHLPKGVFSKTLLLNEKIYLFAGFSDFENLPESNYLSQYIDRLGGKPPDEEMEGDATETDTPRVDDMTAPPTGETNAPPAVETEPAETCTDTAPLDSADASPDTKAPVALPPAEENVITAQDGPAVPMADRQPEPPADIAPEAVITEEGPQATEPASTTEESGPAAGAPAMAEPSDPAADENKTGMKEPAASRPDFLKPVPAVVPEAEREPEKPPFPWKNLAAAVVLFLTLAGTGSYYLWSSSSNPVTPSQPTAVIEQAERTNHAEQAIEPGPATAVTESDTAAEPKPASEAMQEAANTTAEEPPAQIDYHAEIKPDKEGVTIVLHSPEKEPVLRATGNRDTPQGSAARDEATPQTQRTNPAREAIIHIVVKGDTLWDIANHYVNDPYKYPQLARLSRIKNPDRIYPGNRVRILRHRNGTEE